MPYNIYKKYFLLSTNEINSKLWIYSSSIFVFKILQYFFSLVSSIFDKTKINAISRSQHSVTCNIYKLWYHWTDVYLAFYNKTKTYELVHVSNNGTILVSDQRLNVAFQKSTKTDNPDNVTFVFDFRSESCDLDGMYKCHFEMSENLNTEFAELALTVEGIFYF